MKFTDFYSLLIDNKLVTKNKLDNAIATAEDQNQSLF